MSSTTTASPSNKLLIPLTLTTFVVGPDTFIIAGLLGDISKYLQVPQTSAARLVTVFSIVFAVSAPVLGALTANWRRDITLSFGLVVFVIGNVLTAISPTFAIMLLSRASSGGWRKFYHPISLCYHHRDYT